MIPTEGAYAVEVADLDGVGYKDLIFACRNNGSSYEVPSVIHLGGAAGWSDDPDIELSTAGAVYVMPTILNQPDHGGYISEIIEPDTKDDIGAYDTLRYRAMLRGSMKGTITILDAETGESLAETTLVSGDHEWDVRDLISYRDHLSVRILVSVSGLGGVTDFALDDLWLNWTPRIKAAPRVLDISITNTTVYRTESVDILVNVSDEYDPPDELTLLVTHQLEGETEWSTDLLAGRSFENGVWRVEVTPDRFAPLGVYSFRVNVTDRDGLFSGAVALEETLEVMPNLLGPPIILNLVTESQRVRVEWRSPIDTGDLPPDGFRVYRGTAEDELELIATIDAFTFNHLDEDLTNGITYYYAVQAFNDLGDSLLSEIQSTMPQGVPDAPTDLTAESGDGVVTLTWTPPVMDGGDPIIGYHIYRAVGVGSLTHLIQVNETTFVDTGVANGETYTYRVAAVNGIGEGLTGESAVGKPMGLPGIPGEVLADAGIGKITLSWDAPTETGGAPLTGFYIYRGTDPDDMEQVEGLGASIAQYIDEDVVAGTTYYYAVSALTDAGEGALSITAYATPIDVPGIPRDLTAEVGDGSVNLVWSPPDHDGASPITGYVVFRGTSLMSLSELAMLGVESGYRDSTAQNGITYYYTVAALNGAGQGDATDPVEAMPFRPATVPGKVLTLNVETKDGKGMLGGLSPSDDGGSPVTGDAILRGDTPNTMTEIAQVGLVTTYTDDGIDEGKTYYYSIAAINDVGQGEPYATWKLDVPEAEEEGMSVLPIALAIIAVVVIVLVAVLLTRKRGAGPDAEGVTKDEEAPEEISYEEEAPEEGTSEEGAEEDGTSAKTTSNGIEIEIREV
jgi:fibronectin type 3 domain-containing protein